MDAIKSFMHTPKCKNAYPLNLLTHTAKGCAFYQFSADDVNQLPSNDKRNFVSKGIGIKQTFEGVKTMYCQKCGKEIDNEAVVCVFCGVATSNMQKNSNSSQPIVINNSAAASSSAIAHGGRRRHSILFDIFMICITGGLWIIWMIFRPKYY